MEKITEAQNNLTKEVVTTATSDWCIPIVNPTTGEQKMINLSNASSVVAGLLGFYKTFYTRVIGGQHIVTTIPVNGIDRSPKVFQYSISFHTSNEDATYYEHGVLRIGYSGNHVENVIISHKQYHDYKMQFSVSDDEYLTVYYPVDVLMFIHIWA